MAICRTIETGEPRTPINGGEALLVRQSKPA
jgi:hypothetical protein